jgi:hypothetical protein
MPCPLDAELTALRAEVQRLRAELARVRPRPRNVEIVRLRAENTRHWTYKRLAARFGMKAEAVRKVVRRAALAEPDISLMSAYPGAKCTQP